MEHGFHGMIKFVGTARPFQILLGGSNYFHYLVQYLICQEARPCWLHIWYGSKPALFLLRSFEVDRQPHRSSRGNGRQWHLRQAMVVFY